MMPPRLSFLPKLMCWRVRSTAVGRCGGTGGLGGRGWSCAPTLEEPEGTRGAGVLVMRPPGGGGGFGGVGLTGLTGLGLAGWAGWWVEEVGAASNQSRSA